MDLLKKPSNIIVFGGKQYTINYSFDNILVITKLLKDPRITPSLKYTTIYELLEVDPGVKKGEIIQFVNHTLTKYIFKGAKSSGDRSETPSFDFIVDGAHIYVSFLQEYGIDLYNERGKMHFEIFKALFEDLGPDTAIKRIIHIRTCKIPAANKHNREEINNLKQLKLKYSLAIQEDPEIQKIRFQEKMIKWIDGIKKR